MKYDLIVAGGGPAGLMGAITAAEAGKKVLLCEYLPAAGRKLLASGAGKCNLTNVLEPEEMASRYLSSKRFLLPALRNFSSEALRNWFAHRGVPLELAPDHFHFFPASHRAADLLELLLAEISRLGVKQRLRSGISGLQLSKGKISGVFIGQEFIPTSALLLACGGKSYPKLGATGRGYALAAAAGHQIIEPVPALVGLKSAETWGSTLPGVIVPAARMSFGGLSGRTGELIFTHTGISGPAVLDLSGSVARALLTAEKVSVKLSLLPETDWPGELKKWRENSGTKTVLSLLNRHLPQRFSTLLIDWSGIAPEQQAARLSGTERDRLLNHLQNLTFSVSGTDGWSKAMATAGGVSPAELKANTLGSRLIGGLYFAGEMIDVGAPCGGYNIQWAFSSGKLAAAAAVRNLEQA